VAAYWTRESAVIYYKSFDFRMSILEIYPLKNCQRKLMLLSHKK